MRQRLDEAFVDRHSLYFTGTANQLSGRGHQAALSAILKLTRAATRGR